MADGYQIMILSTYWHITEGEGHVGAKPTTSCIIQTSLTYTKYPIPFEIDSSISMK